MADRSQVPSELSAQTASPPEQLDAQDPVASLQAAFPSMDRTIISEVLAGHGGNPDNASLALLEMSSPSSGNTAQSTNIENTVLHAKRAQLASDEAYARELMAQMEREHQEAYGRPLGSPPSQSLPSVTNENGQDLDREYSNLNYVPRQRNRFGQPVGGQQQQPHQTSSDYYGGQGDYNRVRGQDELEQLTEQFNKFADTGKKTFNSFLSKAKDKYAQVQQQRANSAGLSYDGHSTSAPSTGPTTIAGFTLPSIPAPWQNNLNKSSNSRDYVRSESPGMKESAMKDYSASPSPATRESTKSEHSDTNKALPTMTGFSTSPSTPAQPMRMSPATGSITSTLSPGVSTSPTPAPAIGAYSSSPSQLQRHRSNSNPGTSPTKVQMLPRQTISLLDSSRDGRSGASAGTSPAGQKGINPEGDRDDDDDDEEDVEYVRNPFNDDD